MYDIAIVTETEIELLITIYYLNIKTITEKLLNYHENV